MIRPFLCLLRLYKMAISPYMPSRCRYIPTCSEYCYEAVQKFGLIRGIWITLQRLYRCQPRNKLGYDPVPDSWNSNIKVI